MKHLKKFLSIILSAAMLFALVIGAQADTANESETTLLGYQITAPDAAGEYSVRLIASINTTPDKLERFESVGFEVTLSFDDRSDWGIQTGHFSRKTVYSKIFESGELKSVSDIMPSLENGYFFLLPINGLYTDVGSITLSVSTFSVQNGTKTKTEATEIKIEHTADTSADHFVPIGNVTESDRYDLGDGAYEYAYMGVSSDSYSALLSTLQNEGYTVYSENSIDGNLFATYIKGYKQINLSFYPNYNDGSLKAVYSPKGYLPQNTAPSYEKRAEATVTQIGRVGSKNTAAGESFVIQLEDGSFVIIDGGPESNADQVSLYHFLYTNKPVAHTKPQVTWMFTHAHSDHIDLAVSFLEDYSEQIDLKMVCYNFPIFSTVEDAEQTFVTDKNAGNDAETVATLKDILNEKYPNAIRYVYHTGQVLYLAGCKIEFLYTHEDRYPNDMDTLNKTCGVWKMTFKENDADTDFNGNSFLVLGDSETVNCDFMASVYSTTTLDAEMVQASHHGLNGGTEALYGMITPSIVFWPIDSGRSVSDDNSQNNNNDVWDNAANHAWLQDANIASYYADKTITVVVKTLRKRTLQVMSDPFDGFGENTEHELVWDWEAS